LIYGQGRGRVARRSKSRVIFRTGHDLRLGPHGDSHVRRLIRKRQCDVDDGWWQHSRQND